MGFVQPVRGDFSNRLSALLPTFLEEAMKAISEKFGLDSSIVKRSRIEEGAPVPPGLYRLSDL
jgi:hypothetical protein